MKVIEENGDKEEEGKSDKEDDFTFHITEAEDREDERVELMEIKEYEKVEVMVDSGAGNTVCPKDKISSVPTVETEKSRNGGGFKVANGVRIKNEGEKNVKGITTGGQTLAIKMQVTDVDKVLASVSRLTDAGNRVVFEKEYGYIENKKTGKKIDLERKHNVYVFQMLVKGDRGGEKVSIFPCTSS